jgi:ribonuclease-3
MRQWLGRLNSRYVKDPDFYKAIHHITGCKPNALPLYKLALRHSSASQKSGDSKLNNERLEFLGDAILSAVIANYLYLTFPKEEEGFLTSMRSKIVSRESLNQLGQALGLPKLIIKTQHGKIRSNSLYGNALEALIGAVYLDCGYKKAQDFIELKLIDGHLNLQELSTQVASFKGALLEWAQKEKHQIAFNLTGCWGESHARDYHISLYIDGDLKSTGIGKSKKKAEENAAHKTYHTIINLHGQVKSARLGNGRNKRTIRHY